MPSDLNADNAPVSVRRDPNANGLGCIVAFCSIFLLVGLGLFLGLFVRPAIQVMQARSWTPVPCSITASAVNVHRGSKNSTSYSFDPIYTYSVNGQTYTGDRYSFGSSTTGSYNSRIALQTMYPVGGNATCYVNPANPGDAVLNRDLNSDIWLAGLAPLIFVVMGGGVMLISFRTMRAAKAPKAAWRPKAAALETGSSGQVAMMTEPMRGSVFDSGPFQSLDRGSQAIGNGGVPVEISNAGPVTLKANSSPMGRLFGALFICLFWNGIVSVFLFQIGKEIVRGRFSFFEGFMGLFMIPFVLVGIVLIGVFLSQLLALFNARTTVTLSQSSLRPGESIDISWNMRGGLITPQNIKVTVEGREEATYRRGTDTVTDKSTFFEYVLYDSKASTGPQTGARFTLPLDTMHSFESGNNKIIWQVTVHGEIKLWPDVKEEYRMLVKPAVPRT